MQQDRQPEREPRLDGQPRPSRRSLLGALALAPLWLISRRAYRARTTVRPIVWIGHDADLPRDGGR